MNIADIARGLGRSRARSAIKTVGRLWVVAACNCWLAACSGSIAQPSRAILFGIVHESVPTEEVRLADAKVELFDGTTTREAAVTNNDGGFSLHDVTNGMVVKVTKSGYQETSVRIRSSPTDILQVGMPPVLRIIQEDLEGFVPCLGFPNRTLDPNWEAFRFPVHNAGPITFQLIRVPSFECGNSVFIDDIENNRKQPVYNNACCGGCASTINVKGGHIYSLTPASDCIYAPPVPYHVIFSHPN